MNCFITNIIDILKLIMIYCMISYYVALNNNNGEDDYLNMCQFIRKKIQRF